MTKNQKSVGLKTFEGGPAVNQSIEKQLERSIMNCMLWENTFYEDGESIVDRIKKLSSQCSSEYIADLAVKARNESGLRHAPLMLILTLIEKKYKGTADVISKVCTRADMMTELLSLYWLDGKKPLSAQLKKGLAKTFCNFSEYQLAKYNRKKEVNLKDVLFLSHAKPKDKDQEDVWKRLIDNNLNSPETWENRLSRGDDKKNTWELLISENNLGALAYIRNLRNMEQAGVDRDFVLLNLENVNTAKLLPFQIVTAGMMNPWAEESLEKLLFKSVEEKIPGKTIVLVDVSGSMVGEPISSKSFSDRLSAACGLAVVARELFSDIRIFTFSADLVEMPPRRGFALIEEIRKQYHGYTYLGSAIKVVNNLNPERIIVITDEQAHDSVLSPANKGYMINVSCHDRAVGFGEWIRIFGWSDNVLKYIAEMEKNG